MVKTLTYKGKSESGMDTHLEKGFAMRMFLGLFGELHQPMKTIARITKGRLKGDHGGELFPISFSNKINNLKALWDSGMGKFEEYKRVKLHLTIANKC